MRTTFRTGDVKTTADRTMPFSAASLAPGRPADKGAMSDASWGLGDERLITAQLLAVFESSSRAMLPKRYANIDVDDLQEKLRILKAQIR